MLDHIRPAGYPTRYFKKLKQILKNTTTTLVFVLAILFGIVGFVYLSLTIAVSELDDVRLIQFIGIPFSLISTFLSVLLLSLNKPKLFFILGGLNGIAALTAFYGALPGIIDIITFSNEIYQGNQGNNYQSLDLFSIGMIPFIIVSIGWLLWVFVRKDRSLSDEQNLKITSG